MTPDFFQIVMGETSNHAKVTKLANEVEKWSREELVQYAYCQYFNELMKLEHTELERKYDEVFGISAVDKLYPLD